MQIIVAVANLYTVVERIDVTKRLGRSYFNSRKETFMLPTELRIRSCCLQAQSN